MSQSSQADRAEWRPQRFGRVSGRKVIDPLIEPVWVGERVLVYVETSGLRVTDGRPFVAMFDDAGNSVEGFADIAEAIGAATRASALVIDGYLTDQVEHRAKVATPSVVPMPTASGLTRQMIIGGSRRPEPPNQLDRSVPVSPATPTTFVAVDLLLVDDVEVLDVPLLERKRLLESVLEESHLVRRGIYVRPPIDSWLMSWRSIGFPAIAYKAANGHYYPGRDNDGWAIARIPTR